jgi:hypothetical protein
MKACRSKAIVMRLHANYVSAAQAGDYCQVLFKTEGPDDDAADLAGDRPYLLIQRQFETSDGGCCYIETHDHGYIGHYRLRLTVFDSKRLAVEIERKSDTHVEVSFALGTAEFKKVRRIVNIIFGRHE